MEGGVDISALEGTILNLEEEVTGLKQQLADVKQELNEYKRKHEAHLTCGCGVGS